MKRVGNIIFSFMILSGFILCNCDAPTVSLLLKGLGLGIFLLFTGMGGIILINK